jgi:hypothetical protein
LRSAKYLDLSEDLINAIIDIESSSLEDRNEALRRIATLVDNHLNKSVD